MNRIRKTIAFVLAMIMVLTTIDMTGINAAAKGKKVETRPVDVVLVLDNSGSMGGNPMEQLKEACQNFITSMCESGADAKIAVVAYADDAFVCEDFTSDETELLDAIDSMRASGGTNMYEGIGEADRMLSLQPDSDLKYIIHMADGAANEGARDYNDNARYPDDEYGSAVYDYFQTIKDSYGIYSLGFFHSLSGSEKEHCAQLMKDISNIGYQEVTDGSKLTLSFEDVASYVSNTYTLTFDVQGKGTAPEPQVVESGAVAEEPAKPTAKGYEFAGWYKDSTCNTPFTFDTPLTSDTTVYANWASPDEKRPHIVKFDMNGHGDQIDSQEVKFEEVIKKPSTPTAKGYVFEGWYLDKECRNRFSYTTKIVADTTLYAKWDDHWNFSLGDDFDVTVPKDVPIIGNSKISMDMSDIPLAVSVEDGTVKVAINCAELGRKVDLTKPVKSKDYIKDTDQTVFDKEAWEDWKKGIDDLKKTKEKGIKNKALYNEQKNKLKKYGGKLAGANVGFGVDADVTAMGYVEAQLADGGLKDLSGELAVEFYVKVNKEWQTVVVVVPVTVDLEIKVGADINAKLGYNWDDAEFYSEGGFELTMPEIELAGGVGIQKLVKVEAYGSVENKVKFTAKRNQGGSNKLKLSLGGEAGLKASALTLDYKKPLVSNKDDPWVYYEIPKENKKKATVKSMQKNLNKAYKDAYNPKAYEPAENGFSDKAVWNLSDNTNGSVVLQDDVYSKTAPQMVQLDNGTSMLFFIGTDTSRTSEYDRNALMYSVYDKDTGIWGRPQIVDDDGTSDFMPSVTAAGNRVYLTWVDAKSSISSQTDLETMASLCEVNAAVYDAASGKFTTQALTSDASADIMPQVYAYRNGTDTKAYVAWINNSSNDILNMSGTNTIYYSSLQGADDWTGEKSVQTVDKPVTEIAAGGLGLSKGAMTPEIAYTVDQDGDLTADDDVELFVSGVDRKQTQLDINPKTGNVNGYGEDNLVFADLDGTPSFMWQTKEASGQQAQNIIYHTENLKDIQTVSTKEASVSGGFKVINGPSDETYFIGSTREDGKGLIKGAVYSDGSLSYSSTLGEADTITDLAAIDEKDGLNIVYVNDRYTISGSSSENADGSLDNDNLDMTTQTSLRSLYRKKDANLTLEDDLYVQQSDFAPGKTTDLYADITNTGLQTISGAVITATVGNRQLYRGPIDEKILPGQTISKKISVAVPSDISLKDGDVLEVSVRSDDGQIESDMADNTRSVRVGYADLAVSAEQTFAKGNWSQIGITVTNNGNCTSKKKTLQIKQGTASGKKLKSVTVPALKPGESKKITLKPADLTKIINSGTMLYAEVDATDEYYTSDNFATVTAEEVKPKVSSRKLKTFKYSGGVYELNSKKKAVFVRPSSKNKKSFTVPASVKYKGKKYKVVQISKLAFYGCSKLNSVTIKSPDISISANAFRNCRKLKTISFPKLTGLKVTKSAFTGCRKLRKVSLGRTKKKVKTKVKKTLSKALKSSKVSAKIV